MRPLLAGLLAVGLASCGGRPAKHAERPCVPPADPGDPGAVEAALAPLQPSTIRVRLEMPRRRVEQQLAAMMPGETSGTERGNALFARWEADWRVRPTGRPSFTLSDGRFTAEADARLEVRGRLGGMQSSCEGNVRVTASGRLELRPDWTLALSDTRSDTRVGPCRLDGIPIDISGMLEPIADREVDAALRRASSTRVLLSRDVGEAWRQMAEERSVGSLTLRPMPSDLRVGSPSCGPATCGVEVAVTLAAQGWIGRPPDGAAPEPPPLPPARPLARGGDRGGTLRSRLHLTPRALALLAALPDAEGTGRSARTAELRLSPDGPFVTVRDVDGRGLAHLPFEAVSRPEGFVLRRGADRRPLVWPDESNGCLGKIGRQLVARLAESRTVRLPGPELLALAPDVRVEGLRTTHDVVGTNGGQLVVDVVASAESVTITVPEE